MANIGFIGLGMMGKPVAEHLIKGGRSLFLHVRSGVLADLVALGGRAFSSPFDFVAQDRLTGSLHYALRVAYYTLVRK